MFAFSKSPDGFACTDVLEQLPPNKNAQGNFNKKHKHTLKSFPFA